MPAVVQQVKPVWSMRVATRSPGATETVCVVSEQVTVFVPTSVVSPHPSVVGASFFHSVNVYGKAVPIVIALT